MTGRPAPRAAGFTLVELQIALLIVAVMAALMSGALRLSSKTWASVNQQRDQVEHRYLLAQYLRRHLSGARFNRVNTEEHGSVTGFFGDREQINFVAAYPAFHNDGELYWWNFRLDRDEDLDQYNLVARYFPYADGSQRNRYSGGDEGGDWDEDEDEDGGEDASQTLETDGFEAENALLKFAKDGSLYIEDVEPVEIVIARDVAELEFEYFYRDQEGVQKWVDEWQPGNIAPLVIRISLATAVEPPAGEQDRVYLPLPEILITPRFADQKLHVESFHVRR